MGVICNGVQRSGTHLLAKCVENCGYKRIEGVLRPYEFDNKNKHDRRRIELKEFLNSFGDDECVIGHSTYPTYLKNNKIIFVTRNPLDWIVSVARYKENGKPIIPSKESIEYIIKYKLKLLFGYIGWLYNSDLVVRFEDLVSGFDAPIKTIRELLASDKDVDHIGRHINKFSKTYTGKLSNHNALFDDYLWDLFADYNGEKLLRLFNYE